MDVEMAERHDSDDDDLSRQLDDVRLFCEKASQVPWDKIREKLNRHQENSPRGDGNHRYGVEDRLRSDRNELRERNGRYEAQFKLLRTEVKSLQEVNTQLKQKVEDQSDTIDSLKHRGGQSKYSQQVEQLQQRVQQLEQEKANMESSVAEFQDTYTRTLEKNEKLEKAYNRLEQMNKKLQVEKTEQSQDIKRLNTELRETKDRLSKLMSAQVSDNNPDIADLSDKNRPTKLAERYNELYDNQWSDAFEALEKSYTFNNDEEIVKYLLGLLQGARSLCVRKAEEQTSQLTKALFTRECNKSVPEAVKRQLKDITKSMIPSNVDVLYESYIYQLQYYSTSRGLERREEVQRYIRECVLVCWIMVLNDPPIVFGPEVRPYGSLDHNLYKPYTEKGDLVHYVVWPPLLMSESDALLTKGTAQAVTGSQERGYSAAAMARPSTAPAHVTRTRSPTTGMVNKSKAGNINIHFTGDENTHEDNPVSAGYGSGFTSIPDSANNITDFSKSVGRNQHYSPTTHGDVHGHIPEGFYSGSDMYGSVRKVDVPVYDQETVQTSHMRDTERPTANSRYDGNKKQYRQKRY